MVEELSKWKTLLESKQKNAEVVFSDILDEYEVLFNGLHRIFENLNSCDLNTTNSNGAHVRFKVALFVILIQFSIYRIKMFWNWLEIVKFWANDSKIVQNRLQVQH